MGHRRSLSIPKRSKRISTGDPSFPKTEDRLNRILNVAKGEIPFYLIRAPQEYLNLMSWPLVSKTDIEEFSSRLSLEEPSASRPFAGYVVASGGSTAQPVFIPYSHEEVAAVTDNLVFHFRKNGIAEGDTVVNYFGAGDMCGAFSMVDKALAGLPVTILPLSFTPNMDFALEVIERFRPNVVVGIPTLLVKLAQHCLDRGLQTTLEKVYYGGEMMTTSAAEVLRAIWRCEHIRSAGYASTEVGAIGWQCLHCDVGEHFAFADNIVEIVNGEIVVTSLTRTVMPVIRYRTGDRGEWVNARCDCGHGAPLFKLLGRSDTAMIVWGCWIRYDDIVTAFQALQTDFLAIQVEIASDGDAQLLFVRFESALPQLDAKTAESLRTKIYELSGDLNLTFGLDIVDRYLKIQAVPVGTLRRNDRTGKVIPVIDSRT